MSFASRFIDTARATSLARVETLPIEPPAGTVDLGVRWMQVKVPELGVMPIATRPTRWKRTFRTVINLAGTTVLHANTCSSRGPWRRRACLLWCPGLVQWRRRGAARAS